MDPQIFFLLLQDGLSNGAIYVLMGIGLVLIFTVTRVLFLSFGDLISFSALTLSSLERNLLPGTVWLLMAAAVLAFAMEGWRLGRGGKLHRLPRAALTYIGIPAVPIVAALSTAGSDLPRWAEMALTIALVAPLGAILYRIVFQPIADKPVLVLLMVGVALHFVLVGLALIFFGAEGYRTTAFLRGMVPGTGISWSVLIMVGTAVLICAALFAFFRWSILGKALRATAHNRLGAKLVGIKADRMSIQSFALASFIAAVTGIVLGPMMTVYYDTAFLVGMKGFVGAVLGGFVSYPLAAAGAISVGLLESFVAFYASAFKDTIVFFAVIPLLLLRTLFRARGSRFEEEDEA